MQHIFLTCRISVWLHTIRKEELKYRTGKAIQSEHDFRQDNYE